MKLGGQLVSLVLLLGIVLAPAAALSTCWTVTGSSHHGCPPGCPMMTKAAAVSEMTPEAHASKPNCCRISSSGSAPTWQLSASTAQSRIAPSDKQETAASDIIAPIGFHFSDTATPHAVPSQPVLCTFLI